MATYNMFSDLPSIDLECEQRTSNHAHTQNGWQSVDTPYMIRALNAFGLDTSTKTLDRRVPFNADYLAPQVCNESSTERKSGHYRPQWNYNPYELQPNYSAVAPWASAVAPHGHVPLSSSFADDRQPSDQGSCSGGSTWSPVISERRYEGVCTTSDDRDHGSCSQDFHLSSNFPIQSVGGSPHSGSCITLQDVQQYPDSCPEEEFGNFVALHNKSDYSYPLDHDNQPRILSPRRIGAQYAESAILPSRDDDMVQDEVITDYDSDSASDYYPATRHGSNTSRSSRGAKARNPSQNTPKVSASVKHSPRGSKISKRTAKASSNTVATPTNKNLSNPCPHCELSLPTKSALNKHISTVHTRPFSCTFRLYGCPATFGSKNEWKRHVSSQHLRLGIWRCDLGSCCPQQPSPRHSNQPTGEEEEQLIYNDFNRKDLFTQHLRRMHGPLASSSQSEKEAFNNSLEAISQRCLIDIRQPPPQSACGYCNLSVMGKDAIFKGAGSWETRMEHVGRHLESGHGETKKWKEDIGLREYMETEGLIEQMSEGKWRLVGLQVEDGKNKRTKK